MILVRVIWADAHTNSHSSWCDPEELADDGDEWLNETIGYLVAPGKPEHLTVAQSITPDGSVDSVLFIPKAMVRKVSVLAPLSFV